MRDIETIDPRDDPATAALLHEQHQERSVHDVERLLAAARSLVERLPTGPVCLLSRNAEGTAISAAAAAMRNVAGPVRWDQIALHRRYTPPTGYTTVFVDALDLGGSWIVEHVKQLVPDIVVLDGLIDVPVSAPCALAA